MDNLNYSSAIIFAPHPDDEILGCGGTILKMIHQGIKVFVCVVTKGGEPLFHDSDVAHTREECLLLHKNIGIADTFFLDYPAAMLENVPRYELNESLSSIIQDIKPEIVFMPHPYDMQRDHQLVSEALMVALRPKYSHKVKQALFYETLSETEWNFPNASTFFIPNVYSDISSYLTLKLEAMSHYQSQLAPFPNPRSLEAIEALAKYRGSTVCVEAAEAFSLARGIF